MAPAPVTDDPLGAAGGPRGRTTATLSLEPAFEPRGPAEDPWESAPITVAILGSTGSIGRQAIDVVRAFPDRFRVSALAAGSDAEGLLAQARELGVTLVGLERSPSGRGPEAPEGVEVVAGEGAAAEVAGRSGAQVVLNAVVGATGLHATLATLASGKILALANKESLVAAGELVMAKAGPGQIRPVDSEHSALWQVLEGIPADQVRRVFLTGSGGPFRGRRTEDLEDVTVEQALDHPVWRMGRKITVDSASLMNKGLEVIEAHFLFGLTYDEIDVVIHPQGIFHGLAETLDGAFFAHAAVADMRLPIQLALAWPRRLGAPNGDANSRRIDWPGLGAVTFERPDTRTFRCLELAYRAGRAGGTYPAVLNAANEVAVGAFLDRRLRFLDIPAVIERLLEEHDSVDPTLEGVLGADDWARQRAAEVIGEIGGRR
jgi:1-deoxy-D-xylulose-5-phosphate reductoisomerase